MLENRGYSEILEPDLLEASNANMLLIRKLGPDRSKHCWWLLVHAILVVNSHLAETCGR